MLTHVYCERMLGSDYLDWLIKALFPSATLYQTNLCTSFNCTGITNHSTDETWKHTGTTTEESTKEVNWTNFHQRTYGTMKGSSLISDAKQTQVKAS